MVTQVAFEALRNHQEMALLTGAFLVRDIAILPAAVLSTGLLSPYKVFFYSVLGVTLNDIVWFSIFRLFRKHKTAQVQQHANNFIILLVSKFVSGMRLLAIVHLAKLSFIRFVLMNFVATVVWVATLLGIGWLVGRGVVEGVSLYAQAQRLILAGVFLVIVGWGISWLVKHRLVNKHFKNL